MSEQVEAAVTLERRLTVLEEGHKRNVELGVDFLRELKAQDATLVRLRAEFDEHVARHRVTEASMAAVKQERAAMARFVVGLYRSGALPWVIALASAGWFARGG